MPILAFRFALVFFFFLSHKECIFSPNKSVNGNYIQFDTYCPVFRTKHAVVILYDVLQFLRDIIQELTGSR